MHSWTRFLFQLWPVIVVKLYTAMLLLNVDSATQDPVEHISQNSQLNIKKPLEAEKSDNLGPNLNK